METKSERLVPFKAIHAGSILKEELQARGIRQKDFAAQIGMRPSHLSELLNGKRNVTASTAQKLERALGITASFWLSLQKSYELDCIAIEQRDEKESQAAAQEIAALANSGKATEKRISSILGKHGLWPDLTPEPSRAARFVYSILHELRRGAAVY